MGAYPGFPVVIKVVNISRVSNVVNWADRLASYGVGSSGSISTISYMKSATRSIDLALGVS